MMEVVVTKNELTAKCVQNFKHKTTMKKALRQTQTLRVHWL